MCVCVRAWDCLTAPPPSVCTRCMRACCVRACCVRACCVRTCCVRAAPQASGRADPRSRLLLLQPQQRHHVPSGVGQVCVRACVRACLRACMHVAGLGRQVRPATNRYRVFTPPLLGGGCSSRSSATTSLQAARGRPQVCVCMRACVRACMRACRWSRSTAGPGPGPGRQYRVYTLPAVRCTRCWAPRAATGHHTSSFKLQTSSCCLRCG